ncbi:MAG: hypothetical protein HFACDABA_03018 [Anaerolineales bacterium]|nr:hypothetical protein [Anaerolineales bacterium]
MTQEPSNEPISEVPPTSEIEKFLQDLQSSDISTRRQGIQSARGQNITDARVVEALKTLASNDPAGSVRKEAKKSLKELGIEPPLLAPELAAKRRDFWLGVGIFFGLNLLLWAIQIAVYALVTTLAPDFSNSDAMTIIGIALNLIPWVINIGLLIFLAFKRPQMALGMLAGFGISLLIVVCLFLITLAVCFVLLGSYQ